MQLVWYWQAMGVFIKSSLCQKLSIAGSTSGILVAKECNNKLVKWNSSKGLYPMIGLELSYCKRIWLFQLGDLIHLIQLGNLWYSSIKLLYWLTKNFFFLILILCWIPNPRYFKIEKKNSLFSYLVLAINGASYKNKQKSF
jgi:hypothetical protein